MEDKSYGFMTEESWRLLEEYNLCQSEEDIQALKEREKKLNESCDPVEIPHLDMTYAEFLEKYNCVDSEEIRRKYGL